MTILERVEEILGRADENTAVSVEIIRKPVFDRKTGENLGVMVTRLQINTRRFNNTGPSGRAYTNLLEPLSQEYLEKRLLLLREKK